MPPQPGRGIIRPSGRVGIKSTGRVAIAGASGQSCGCCGGVGPLCMGCGTGQPTSTMTIVLSGITYRDIPCLCGGSYITWLQSPNRAYTLNRIGLDPSICEFQGTPLVVATLRRCTDNILQATYSISVNAFFSRDAGPPASFEGSITASLNWPYGNIFMWSASRSSCMLDVQPFHEIREDGPPPNPTCTVHESHTTATATVSFP